MNSKNIKNNDKSLITILHLAAQKCFLNNVN